ncbi:CYTH domain-containing protein [Virgibacillus sp. MSP4-1]|uniref:CYTH domain-containing protein n=1 Tax=Virgibacillus sp. MSP4-1 TaxID=2700081 RepID=UPI0003A08A69|nr:CYTH domain-containing protein [Virgibacillus sp. MSP4-1]QHS21698.1 CYTH domain-containing protein [Virgibacillus sp. MSP4-1]
MHEEIEIEFKNMLTRAEYHNLLNAFHLDKQTALKQVNHYFETNDLHLKNKGSALRIRKKNGRYVFTLKEPHQDGLLETHADISSHDLTSCKNGTMLVPENIKKRLIALEIPVDQLKYMGELQTLRLEKEWHTCLLVFDHSFYADTEDFELELEAPGLEYGREVFDQLLRDFNIKEKPTKNKIQRFFDAI